MWETVFEAGSVEEAWEGSFIGGIPCRAFWLVLCLDGDVGCWMAYGEGYFCYVNDITWTSNLLSPTYHSLWRLKQCFKAQIHRIIPKSKNFTFTY